MFVVGEEFFARKALRANGASTLHIFAEVCWEIIKVKGRFNFIIIEMYDSRCYLWLFFSKTKNKI